MLQINASKVGSTQNNKSLTSTKEKAEASISPIIILPLLTGEKENKLFKGIVWSWAKFGPFAL